MILAFDTSAAHCAAALLSEEGVHARRHEEMARGQGERLIGLLEEVLAEGGAAWSDLTRIGVGTGPGNFTGIRISVSAARGLALGLGIPAIGVTHFECVLHAARQSDERLGAGRHLVSLPYKGGLYLQPASASGIDGMAAMLPDAAPSTPLPRLADPGALHLLGERAGDLARRYAQEGIPLGGHRDVTLAPDALAEAIAHVALTRPAQSPRPTPHYIKAPDAAPSRHAAPCLLP
ncbi:tRNA (adenosine(37)-N6)-threonylcarbamoyltransferase complex dimerization subunit type 1 TsaB [Profundibacterium mesophilum]|uniref:DNA polymerase I n=1 Tax=Profundibacterium mesophilum KAUST100406-0324 TaxID=1037889 RepID=A0A921TC69_9RHOB|nr:tRNA (adenosine(37)-N6)-threonylcarbamoyltransferase complex dimerization subunit type 1 TsaB [Profundibacterium mesophilum]KAF0675328.1 DNA polymerase I [Profundibacterium mesophilum KAUST100406-0324]